MINTFKVCNNNKNKDSKMAKYGNKNAAGPHNRFGARAGAISGLIGAKQVFQGAMYTGARGSDRMQSRFKKAATATGGLGYGIKGALIGAAVSKYKYMKKTPISKMSASGLKAAMKGGAKIGGVAGLAVGAGIVYGVAKVGQRLGKPVNRPKKK